MYAYLCVNFQEISLVQTATYMYMPMISMIYHKSAMPFKSVTLNYIEIINDCFLLWTGMAMIIFSNFVTDIKMRYDFGFVYMNSIICILIVNFILIMVESISMYKQNLKVKNKNKLLELIEL